MPRKNKQPEETTIRRSGDVREQLKAIIDTELARLPETLEKMEPSERVSVVLKLIPYVLPKVKPLPHTYDAPPSSAWDFL